MKPTATATASSAKGSAEPAATSTILSTSSGASPVHSSNLSTSHQRVGTPGLRRVAGTKLSRRPLFGAPERHGLRTGAPLRPWQGPRAHGMKGAAPTVGQQGRRVRPNPDA